MTLSYLEQLRRWLEEQRSVRVDIIASIKVGKMAEESVSTVTSFVTVPGKGKSQLPRRGKIARQEPEQVECHCHHGQRIGPCVVESEVAGHVTEHRRRAACPALLPRHLLANGDCGFSSLCTRCCCCTIRSSSYDKNLSFPKSCGVSATRNS